MQQTGGDGRPSLDELGIAAGTGKSSLQQDYLTHYETALARLRDQTINIIEIGIGGGASLKMWENYFSRATIVGIDINPSYTRYATERTKIEIGSQDDLAFLSAVVERYPPTVIIDDGSHRADHIRLTFEHLFPLLAPGGVYAIEDLHVHFGSSAGRWRGDGALLPHEYVALLTKHLAQKGREKATATEIPPAIVEWVARVDVIPRGVVIWKAEGDRTAPDFARLRALVGQSDDINHWHRFAAFVVAHGGPLDLAEEAMRRVLSRRADRAAFHETLAHILKQRGDAEGADAATRRASALAAAGGAPHQNGQAEPPQD